MRAGELLRSVGVDSHSEEPEKDGGLPEETAREIDGGQFVGERRGEIGEPGQAGKCDQCAETSGHEGRFEDEVADQDAKDAVKYHSDVGAMSAESNRFQGDAGEVEGCREQGEVLLHGPKDVIEDQCDGGHADELQDAGGAIEFAGKDRFEELCAQ